MLKLKYYQDMSAPSFQSIYLIFPLGVVNLPFPNILPSFQIPSILVPSER